MFRNIITLLMFCCLSFNANAQVIALKEGHPDRHVVVKGDTLWWISARFLKDPWLWPKVWQLNRSQIKNPHLIYPGDVIVLDLSSGQPQLKLLRQTITLEPGVIAEPLSQAAISTIPLNAITPFLSQPLVIEKDQLAESPRIIAGQDNRVVLSTGTRVYVNNIEPESDLNWYIYRPGDSLIDPDSKEVLGVEATYLGDLKVKRFGSPATAVVVKAKEEIFVKDRLVPSGDEVITNFTPRAPETQIKGRLLKVYGGLAEAGPESIVSINRGSQDGVEVGHVLAISRYGRIIKDPEPTKAEKDKKPTKAEESSEPALEPGYVKLPDERVGLLMVFRVFDRISYGLVMQANEPINTLDAIHNP